MVIIQIQVNKKIVTLLLGTCSSYENTKAMKTWSDKTRVGKTSNLSRIPGEIQIHRHKQNHLEIIKTL